MKSQYINTIAEGTRIDSVFAVSTKELRSSRSGEAYLSLQLGDRTGRMAAVMFKPDAAAQELPAGTVARVEGVATTFRGVRRISVERVHAAEKWDPADLLPASPRDVGELLSQLRALVRTVDDPNLARLLRVVFGDKAFMRTFLACPAAQSNHHAYLGGLLEHTVGVATLCAQAASQYRDTDRDLLVTGALLHDVGKVEELTFSTTIEYTDAGRFVGHIVLGEARLRRAIDRLTGFPEGLAMRLTHLILSHHGELESGSPKQPCTLEAVILHQCDELDAQASGFVQSATGASRVEEQWTDSQNQFGRPLYAPIDVLAESGPSAPGLRSVAGARA